MHERTSCVSAAVEGSSDPSFGIVFTFGYLISALYPWYCQRLRLWSMIIAVGFLLPLHKIVSPIALGIVFS
jgi:hypothetical protein